MQDIRIAITDLVSNSYFPVLAAEELGLYRAEGADAHVELVMPLRDAYAALGDGAVDFVADAVHDCLPFRPAWQGLRVLMALQQGTPWLLVLRSALNLPRGDLEALKGLTITAALGPDYVFKRILADAGLDAARDGIEIYRLPGAEAAGVSYGVTAARALETGQIDGFFANAMGAEVAVTRGVGTIHLDVRRGDEPAAAAGYSFGSLLTTAERVERDPDLVAAVIRAVVAAQRTLREDPRRATEVGNRRFPTEEAGLIRSLVERDRVFYDPEVSQESVATMADFAIRAGLLTEPLPYEAVVATRFRELWA